MPTAFSELLSATRVPVFFAGTQTDSSGKQKTWTIAELDEAANAYNEATEQGLHDAPCLHGHRGKHAFGWLERVYREGNTLFADLKNVVKDFADGINNKLHPKRSISFYPPEHPNNPTPGRLNINHLAWLPAEGEINPAVKGLPDVSFSDGDFDGCMEYLDVPTPMPWTAMGAIANLFQSMREHLIEAEDVETADDQIPQALIDKIKEESGNPPVSYPEFDRVVANLYSQMDNLRAKINEFVLSSDSVPMYAEGDMGGFDARDLNVIKILLDRRYDDGVDSFESVKIDDNDNIVGVFLDEGQRMAFRISDNEVAINNADSASFSQQEWENDYWESVAPYEFKTAAVGSKERNCVKGKSCKGTCIARNRTCRDDLLPDEQNAVKQIKQKVKGGGKASTSTAKGKGKKQAIAPEAKQDVQTLVKGALLALPAAGQSSAPENKKNGPPLSERQIKSAVLKEFGTKNVASLARSGRFKMATSSWDATQEGAGSLDLKNPDHMKRLYRQFVGVLPDERFQSGPTAINGRDVFMYFRPWQVFNIDPKDPKYQPPKGLKGKEKKQAEKAADAKLVADVKTAYNQLSKKYHPDVGGDRRVFERLTQMKNSLTATF